MRTILTLSLALLAFSGSAMAEISIECDRDNGTKISVSDSGRRGEGYDLLDNGLDIDLANKQAKKDDARTLEFAIDTGTSEKLYYAFSNRHNACQSDEAELKLEISRRGPVSKRVLENLLCTCSED